MEFPQARLAGFAARSYSLSGSAGAGSMTLRACLVAVLAVAASLGVSACEYSPEMADRSMAFNDAVAQSSNALLFRNIVRASERRPTYYSRVASDTSASTLTPSLSLGLPLTRSSSLEQDASGAGILTATKSTHVLAAVAANLGLTAPVTNTLSLQSMDDQKYQAGMMRALNFTQLKGYFDEGYGRDLLMLMFIARVRVKDALLADLDAGVAEKCAAANPTYQCQYIKSDPYAANFAGGDWRDHWSLENCARSGGAYPDRTAQSVSFVNDPAQEILPPGSNAARTSVPHPQMCFEILLQDLLALGLDITAGGASSSVAESDVPAAVADDPTFRLEMMKENVKIVKQEESGNAVLCKSKPESVAFTLQFPRDSGTRLGALGAALDSDANSARQSSAKRNGASCDAGETREQQSGDSAVRLASKDFEFTERSFESMIYYLGEIARADENGVDPLTIVRVQGRNPSVTGPSYTESLFYASSELDSDDAALSVIDDHGKKIYLADLCPKSIHLAPAKADGGGCSVEFPDNESIAVISLLNQVWGLQKEYTAPPSQPVVLANPQ